MTTRTKRLPGQPTQKEVLELVNKCRVATGLEPLKRLPKGTPRNPTHCPLARALNFDASVTPSYIRVGKPETAEGLIKALGTERFPDSATEVRMPSLFAQFIEHFDREHYPSLID